MLRSFKNNKTLQAFVSALVFTSLCSILAYVVFKGRYADNLLQTPEETPPSVFTKHVERQIYPINLQLYGTAEAGETFILKAPATTKVTYAADLYPGKVVQKDELLLSFDQEKFMRKLAAKQTEKHKTELDIQKLQEKCNSTEFNVKLAQDTLQLAKQTLAKKQEYFQLDKDLFARNEVLHSAHVISLTEYQSKKQALLSAELDFLAVKDLYQKQQQQTHLLESELTQLQLEIQGAHVATQILDADIAQLQEDLSHTTVTAPRTAKIAEIHVQLHDEISEGEPLLTLEDTRYIDLLVNIPDSYFKWIYANNLWQHPENIPITLELVNYNYPKQFNNAYVQSIGPQLNKTSRSLPILIRRSNLIEDNTTTANDDLIPGMYCKVTLTLHELDNVFLIPETALQDNGNLLLVKEVDNAHILSIITQPEILFEEDGYYIIRLPQEYGNTLNMISHPLQGTYEGMPVTVHNGEVVS